MDLCVEFGHLNLTYLAAYIIRVNILSEHILCKFVWVFKKWFCETCVYLKDISHLS